MSQVSRSAMRIPTMETVAATAARSEWDGVEYVGGDEGTAVGSVNGISLTHESHQKK